MSENSNECPCGETCNCTYGCAEGQICECQGECGCNCNCGEKGGE